MNANKRRLPAIPAVAGCAANTGLPPQAQIRDDGYSEWE